MRIIESIHHSLDESRSRDFGDLRSVLAERPIDYLRLIGILSHGYAVHGGLSGYYGDVMLPYAKEALSRIRGIDIKDDPSTWMPVIINIDNTTAIKGPVYYATTARKRDGWSDYEGSSLKGIIGEMRADSTISSIKHTFGRSAYKKYMKNTSVSGDRGKKLFKDKLIVEVGSPRSTQITLFYTLSRSLNSALSRKEIRWIESNIEEYK